MYSIPVSVNEMLLSVAVSLCDLSWWVCCDIKISITAALTFSPLYSCHSLLFLSSTSTSIARRSSPPSPVCVTCYRGKNNADITLIMQFHQLGAGRDAFFSNRSETTGHSSLHICPESVCVRVCVCVRAWLQWRVHMLVSTSACLCLIQLPGRSWERERVIKGHREWEKYCSNPRAACCSSGGVMYLLTHTHTHTHTRKIAQNKQLLWLAKVSRGALKHMFLIREFDSPSAITLQALPCHFAILHQCALSQKAQQKLI